ncbi:MAG TPA: hypothetical protein VIL30_05675 [Ramlibacter sp.]
MPGVRSEDTQVDGATGPLPARIYTPEGAGPFPVIVYFHGGGWVIADKDVYDGGAWRRRCTCWRSTRWRRPRATPSRTWRTPSPSR